MLWYDLIVENKELLKIFYALIVAIICMFIFYKTNKLFKISSHQGIRYLRNAFLFYAIAFIIRYFLGVIISPQNIYFFLVRISFEFFMIMAGFFLLYSLLWKKIESFENYHSLFNKRIFVFYGFALILSILDLIWNTGYFMFFSQITLFIYASIISFINYKRKGRQHKFLKFYLMAMLLSFTAWILNALAALYFEWDKGMMINIYGINITFFLLFLYGIIKVTKLK